MNLKDADQNLLTMDNKQLGFLLFTLAEAIDDMKKEHLVLSATLREASKRLLESVG